MDSAAIEHRFAYHVPVAGMPERQAEIRSKAKSLAHLIDSLVGDGHEKDLIALAIIWLLLLAHTGIAREGA